MSDREFGGNDDLSLPKARDKPGPSITPQTGIAVRYVEVSPESLADSVSTVATVLPVTSGHQSPQIEKQPHLPLMPPTHPENLKEACFRYFEGFGISGGQRCGDCDSAECQRCRFAKQCAFRNPGLSLIYNSSDNLVLVDNFQAVILLPTTFSFYSSVCIDQFANLDLIPVTATVQKIITEILPSSSGLTFAKDARDLLIECCVEFITLISSEANDIAEKEAKKTIACDHVEKALRELGFDEYVQEVLDVASEHKEQLKTREKKQSKLEQSGLPEEELLKQQQELFRSATDKYNQAP
ncbi:MAG: hypothetical protein M1830_000931 [Pleopsidium flavum]|nr:MAG: hypothetical protein M1830_000931 [Pleopsidium flavum]